MGCLLGNDLESLPSGSLLVFLLPEYYFGNAQNPANGLLDASVTGHSVRDADVNMGATRGSMSYRMIGGWAG